MNKKKVLGALLSLAVAVTLGVTVYYTTNNNVKLSKDMEGKVSEYNVGLSEDGQFYIQPVRIKTELGQYDAYYIPSITHDQIITLDNYGETTFMTYTDKDKTTLSELLISTKIPSEVNMKGLDGTISHNKVKTVKDGSTLKGITELHGGRLFMALTSDKLTEESNFESEVKGVSAALKYANRTGTSNIICNIDGLGTLDLNKISAFKSSAGMFYGKDKILRLYNYKEDKVYVWITHINNSLMLNTTGNIQKTHYNNVYVDKDYKNKDMMGYNTYSIMTKKGMYSIKFNECSPEGLKDEIFKALNINKDDEKIELPFKLTETDKVTEQSIQDAAKEKSLATTKPEIAPKK